MKVVFTNRNKQLGFTLAEVLITLGIIGVVAAITMPTLMSNIQDRVRAKRIENIHQKLSKVTDKMAVQSGLTGYGTTMDFIQEMAKHMKITKICDNEHLAECWPTQKVIISNSGKTWDIADTKTAKELLIPAKARKDWDDTVGIITGDGTGMILSYNKNCSFDVDSTGLKYNSSTGKSNSLNCLSGIYDWNGSNKPNKLEKDVIKLGIASGLGVDCSVEINGKCYTAPFSPTPLTYAECEEQRGELGINACYGDDDYWAGAVSQCGGVDKMLSMDDLSKFATEFYKNHPSIGPMQTIYDGITLDQNAANSLGFSLNTSGSFFIWSGQEGQGGRAYSRYFGATRTDANNLGRYGNGYAGYVAMCVGE